MKHTQDSFYFPKQLGERLRQLREKARLSQHALALCMGRDSSGGQHQVSRIERGALLSPSLRFIADYLRACGARFRDLGDLLDNYTEQPSVLDRRGKAAVQSAIARLPAKMGARIARKSHALAGRASAGTSSIRVERVQKLARSWLVRREVERTIYAAISELGLSSRLGLSRPLAAYGRRVWKILSRTSGADDGRGDGLLAEAKEWLDGQNVYTVAEAAVIERATIDLHAELERRGALDVVPTLAEAQELAAQPTRVRVRKVEDFCRDDFRADQKRRNQARSDLIGMIWSEAQPILDKAGVPLDERTPYKEIVRHFLNLFVRHTPDSTEWQQAADECLMKVAGAGGDVVVAREVQMLVSRRAGAEG